ncbi:MAG TPA: hypothetical protein VGT02_10205 [Methylomirabilota bacterium]|nr:hypothetical protein [Methylomirabilota bacterium]
MTSVAGIFTSREAAERAAQRLASSGFAREHLTLLTPGTDVRRVEAAVPLDEGEAPGTGAAIGAVTGIATGAGIGVPIGAAVSLMVPGIGPIIAFGLLGAALFGAGGAAIGSALEHRLAQGVPHDDLFVFEQALRSGHSVVVALVEDAAEADRAHAIFREAGALDMETARDRWWSGLTAAERGRFEPVEEHVYRCGFEAAQWCDDRENVRPLHGALIEDAAFQRGWERGLQFRRARDLKKTA